MAYFTLFEDNSPFKEGGLENLSNVLFEDVFFTLNLCGICNTLTWLKSSFGSTGR